MKKSSDEFSGTAGKFQIMEFVRQENAEELDNAGKKQIGFGGQDIGGFAVGNAQRVFQGID